MGCASAPSRFLVKTGATAPPEERSNRSESTKSTFRVESPVSAKDAVQEVPSSLVDSGGQRPCSAPTGASDAVGQASNSLKNQTDELSATVVRTPKKETTVVERLETAIKNLPGKIDAFAKLPSPTIADRGAYRPLFYSVLLLIDTQDDRELSIRWADELAKQNFISRVVVPLWPSIFDTEKNVDLLAEEAPSKDALTAYRMILTIIWNCSDRSTELCKQICACKLIPKMLDILSRPYFEPIGSLPPGETDKDWKGDGVSENDKLKFRTFEAFIGVLHNCFQHCYQPTRDEYREANGGEIIRRFSEENRVPIMRAKAVIVLAYGVEENSNDMITSGGDIFNFIVQTLLRAALENTEQKHKAKGFSVEEIVAALNLLAANDANKLHIFNAGVLPLYGRLLTDFQDEKELFVAVRGLWILSFHAAIRAKLAGMKEIVKNLEDLEKNARKNAQLTNGEQIEKAASGALWNLQVNDRKSAKARQSAKAKLEQSAGKDKKAVGNDEQRPHVMISYCWAHKPVALKVNELLKDAGFETWIDVDKMTGSTLDAMAAAVEQASVILMLISEEYKNSPSCRMEAEYAMRLRKEIVPVLTQYRYRADGWLGILVGAKLYFDCSTLEKVDTNFHLVAKELANHGAVSALGRLNSPAVQVVHPTVSSARPLEQRMPAGEGTRSELASWTTQNVADWLRQIGLPQYVGKFEKIDGVILRELYAMCDRAPDTYYRTVEQKLGFNDPSNLSHMLAFTHELKVLCSRN